MKAILDCCVYHKLEADQSAQALVRQLVEQRLLVILVTRTVWEELQPPPFQGVPSFFPVKYAGNTVGRCGITHCGDSIGRGDVFDAHLGDSNKVNDALIVDAADLMADWIVSEDLRLRKRVPLFAHKCEALSFEEFKQKLIELEKQ